MTSDGRTIRLDKYTQQKHAGKGAAETFDPGGSKKHSPLAVPKHIVAEESNLPSLHTTSRTHVSGATPGDPGESDPVRRLRSMQYIAAVNSGSTKDRALDEKRKLLQSAASRAAAEVFQNPKGTPAHDFPCV